MLDGIPLTGVRLVGAFLGAVVLVYWTTERLLGQGDDPTLRKSVSSDTGSVSMLVSGSMAVAMVASLVGALLLLPIGGTAAVSNPVPVVAFLGVVVVAHWYVEKEERE